MTLEKDIRDLNSSWEGHIRSYKDDINRIRTTLGSIESKATEMLRQNRYVIDKIDVELLTSKLSALTVETELMKRAREILKSLDYEQRHARHEAIPLAHQQTFRWALQERRGPGSVGQGYLQSGVDFPRWLQEGNDTFWISGKPGSGKSTLMKFIAGHKDTRHMLDNTLADQTRPGIKFCIFVDGLDEFEGDPLDLIKPLQALSKSSLVKLCVASRPWNAFEQAFGQRSDLKLYVHDLTSEDIRAFASDRLKTHPNWGSFASEEDSNSIIENITERSGGVFLWVFLVTRELREGLNNFDTLADLKKRLHKMPSELGPFFKHILASVDSFYQAKTAETLRLSLAADEANRGFSMPFSLYYFHDKEYDDPGFALRMPVEPKPEANTAMHMRQRVHYRLNGICKGLLELNGNFVGYLHRTVRDWLRDPEMQQYLEEKSAATFNPFEAILSASLAGIKSTRFTDGILTRKDGLAYTWHGKLNHRLREALSYVSYAETARHSDAEIVQIVDCLGDSVEKLFAVNGAQFSLWTEAPARNPRMMFRQHLLEARLWDYISLKLQHDPGYFAQYPATPFYALLRDDTLASHSRMVWTQERVELVNGVLAEEQNIASGRSYDSASADRVIWTLMIRDCLPENMVDIETIPTAENLCSFMSALELGIMSTLASRLQLSAEIYVAHTPLISIPSWFGLILLLFKCGSLSCQRKEESIQVLEECLESPSTSVARLGTTF
ncbi:hypothetical protein KVR01_002544 [Diaporthe batatas]|uniref:uncharacterized protein n=1 Tax=Diaporthe batatas TaxID=748121 RepID=UPI001D057A8A|nr:uncharacterized protein KVR01_002544 [Diaporthe batatas]KAG8166855.1 hypothetical protein KVR01_002544 [Diaporthe batatas]